MRIAETMHSHKGCKYWKQCSASVVQRGDATLIEFKCPKQEHVKVYTEEELFLKKTQCDAFEPLMLHLDDMVDGDEE